MEKIIEKCKAVIILFLKKICIRYFCILFVYNNKCIYNRHIKIFILLKRRLAELAMRLATKSINFSVKTMYYVMKMDVLARPWNNRVQRLRICVHSQRMCESMLKSRIKSLMPFRKICSVLRVSSQNFVL
jgi:hypothetical protein